MLEKWREALKGAEAGESKYKALVRAIAYDIEQGTLAELQRLPSQRRVATALGISGQTVVNAYQELERQGMLRGEVGRGTFVSRRFAKNITTYILDDAQALLADLSTARLIHTSQHDQFWRETCAELSTEEDQPWIRACRPIAGFLAHRQIASAWLARFGFQSDPARLFITNGATHAIFLALATVAGHGDIVLCEGLTDHGILGCARVLGFTLKGLETDQYGIKPDDLEDMCSSERVVALVCTPNLSNPTVSLMSTERRREIASITASHGVYLIENDVYGPLLGRPDLQPISSLIPDWSFYCSTMAKSVMTGLRVGYLAAPPKMALKAESILRVNSWMSMPVMAEVASRWIQSGKADVLINLQRELVSARQTMIGEYLGDYVIGSHPYALIVWLRVPPYWQLADLVKRLRDMNIAVTSSEPFTIPGIKSPHAIRMSLGAEISDDLMRQTLTTIAEVFANVA